MVIDQIVRLATCVSDGLQQAELAGAGVSSPGPLDTTAGVALGIPTIAGFAGYPMREEIGRRLSLPVALENDGIAAAIGEWKFGAGRGRDNLVYVTVSTGIGGGVIADGRVLRGRRGMAGHVGHMSFVQDGELCVCGGRGCFEAYGSGSALAQRARAAALDDPSSSLKAVAGRSVPKMSSPLPQRVIVWRRRSSSRRPRSSAGDLPRFSTSTVPRCW